MSITKTEYILRSLKKITHKKWEFFVISRILHGLSDDEIEFITQQLMKGITRIESRLKKTSSVNGILFKGLSIQ